MFSARITTADGGERPLTAQTEAEMRVELRLISHAGGSIASGEIADPEGRVIAAWQPASRAWHRPDGEPWGVE